MANESIFSEFIQFASFFWKYLSDTVYGWFTQFEGGKGKLVDTLYSKRGKYTRPFVHGGMVSLLFVGVTVGPVVVAEPDDSLEGDELPQAAVLGMATQDIYAQGTTTMSSEGVLEYRGGEVIEHEVQSGETLSEIAERYGLQESSVRWSNGLDDSANIKAGQTLKILPVDGVMHKVKKGETVYSIAKKYNANPQAMVDYAFNTFTNDETFELAVGQQLMVPDGVMPEKQEPAPTPRTYYASSLTPDAGKVSALGNFVWPTSGYISQPYRFYHQAIDIAGNAGAPVVAADGGTVTISGWVANEGYGNRVVVNHGNGYNTLYAHMSRVAVVAGQSVNPGDVVGYVGSTGRSTGPHLHFEIRAGRVLQNPLNFLK